MVFDLIYTSRFLPSGLCALSPFPCSLSLLPVSLSFCSIPNFCRRGSSPTRSERTGWCAGEGKAPGSDFSRGFVREYSICSHDSEGLAAPRALHAMIPLPGEPGKPRGWTEAAPSCQRHLLGTKAALGGGWRLQVLGEDVPAEHPAIPEPSALGTPHQHLWDSRSQPLPHFGEQKVPPWSDLPARRDTCGILGVSQPPLCHLPGPRAVSARTPHVRREVRSAAKVPGSDTLTPQPCCKNLAPKAIC